MAESKATNGKRKLPAAGTSKLSRKRAKFNQKTKPGKSKRVVPVDDLPWKTVDVPEMHDDAEGFFGLEEVEGVDIVRHGDKVQFVAAIPQKDTKDKTGDGDEFEGFDDKPEAITQEPKPAEPVAHEKGKKEKKAKKGPKKEPVEDDQENSEGQEAVPEESALESTDFAALGQLEDDDEDVDLSAWAALDLAPQILTCLSKLKFGKPTAIQAATIPEILAGRDVIGKAATGSGKTLAFAIPIVQSWLAVNGESSKKSDGPTALILSPTRELAHQITQHIKDLCAGLATAPYVCSVTGGLSVHKQQRQLETADIVIATPGRLWEVISGSTELLEKFKAIKFLVVDEADRLLSEGHFKDAEEILNALDREVDEEDDEEEEALSPRQTLVFSATFNKGLQQKLAGKGKFDLMNQAQSMEYLLKKLKFREEKPKFIDVNPVSQMAEGLREGLVECGAMEKDLYLYSVLLLQPTQRTLVFTNSISSVRRLTPMLQNLNLTVLALHSQMPQKARLRSVERFTSSKPNTSVVLVATDVAARGLDIPGIDAVIHYHVPRTADAYVHRSGRTARAQTSGASILLCGPEEVVPTRRLIAKVHASSKAAAGQGSEGNNFFVRTLEIDRRIVSRLRERLVLAKKIADSALAKEKGSKEDDWMRNAADELGVEYDSEELEKAGKWSGRGSGRKVKMDEARGLSKAEMGALRAQLRQLLAKRVNTGVSERYIARGDVDVDELLKGGQGEFLGQTDMLDFDS